MPAVHTLARLSFALAASVGAVCAADAPTAKPAASPVAKQVLAVMDPKADPCQDFYRYACGGWLDSTKLPADQSRWGRGFTEIAERNRLVLRDLLTAAQKSSDPDTAKLGAFYASCTDDAAIEKAGTAPLKPYLDRIATVKDVGTLMDVAGQFQATGINVLLSVGVEPDFKNPDLAIAQFSQGGLGLPDRDYYFRNDDRSEILREQYLQTMATMFGLLGQPAEAAQKDALAVLALETKLADFSRGRADMRDPDKLYNKVDLEGVKKLAPALPWDAFMKAADAGGVTLINVATPEFLQGLNKELPAASPETLRAYLRWHLLRASAMQLPKAFQDAAFNFYGKTLSGQKEMQARWKRCIVATDGALGELLGKAFVAKQFPGDSKTIALEMIRRVEAAFGSGLPQLSWMDDETRGRALAKLGAVANKIGYPDKWRDYSKLEVKAGDYFGNVMRANRFAADREIAKVGKPVDKTEWGMTPPTVNAYYNPLANEMVFPAGILQPPFFDRSFPAAMNFGGIGMVMGHELTHGFDDQGRKFAADGKLVEWWKPEVSAKFEERTKCIGTLYGGFEVQPGVKLDGKLTMGENIADFGGIKAAYRAFRQYAKENPATTLAVPGLTDDQLFFVGFAQTWCSLATPEIERQLAVVDPHSPPRFRVNGPVSNFADFAEAFACKKGTPMNPATSCTIW